MQIKELISKDIQPLQLGITIQEALDALNECGMAHLPVVKDSKVLGVISAKDIYIEDADQLIDRLIDSVKICRVYENIHEFELIRFFGETGLTSMSIVTAGDEFLGIVSLQEVIKEITIRFARMQTGSETGGILTLEIGRNDFYLSEIARIVESNDTKILAMYVSQPYENGTTVDVNLHLDRPDIRNLLATFERFKYNVKASHLSEEEWAILQERFNAVMRYINL
jgi:high-affinity K+ transport system ATPase subunit B